MDVDAVNRVSIMQRAKVNGCQQERTGTSQHFQERKLEPGTWNIIVGRNLKLSNSLGLQNSMNPNHNICFVA
jgi:hypothetical protein